MNRFFASAAACVTILALASAPAVAVPTSPVVLQAQNQPSSGLPADVAQALTQAAAQGSDALEAQVLALVSANPKLVNDIVSFAVKLNPTDAAGIVVAAVAGLPPGQRDDALAGIVAAADAAAPGSGALITTAIDQLISGRNGNILARFDPLVPPHTDPNSSPR